MKRKLLDFLACPECKSRLTLKVSDQMSDGEIVTGELGCLSCERTYPIVNGVPRFVPHYLEPTAARTVKAFGDEWQTFNDVARSGQMGSRELFLDFIKPVSAEYLHGKVVLDAGCGTGRFCKTAAELGADQVIGLDLSNSVDLAHQNLRQFPNVHILQADISKLPLGQVFDYVFSIGVLHHTTDPRKSFQSIVKLLNTGGGVSVWVYSQENNAWVIHVVNPIRIHLTSRLPRKMLYALSFLLTGLLRLILQVVYKPVNSSPRISWARKWLFYNDYLFFLSRFGFHEQLNIVYDHLVPELAFYISREELEAWFEENNLQDVAISSRSGNSWRGFGVRKF